MKNKRSDFIEKSENEYPVVVISGSDVVILGIARSLGMKNIPVVVVSRGKKTFASYSRFVTRTILCPDPIKHEKESISCLITFGKDMKQQYGRRILLLPSTDVELLLISKYYKMLIEYFVILGNPREKEGLQKFIIRKDLFFEKVKEANIPMPLTIPCLNEKDIDYAVKNMTYPCIIKPAIKDISFSFFNYYHAKVIECDSPDSLRSTLQDVLSREYEVIVQEKIVEEVTQWEDTISLYINRNGEILAAFIVCKSRNPPFSHKRFVGNTILLSRWEPQLFEIAKLVLKELNFWGISQIEFKKDSRDGKFKIIEMNFRPFLSISFPTACGINFPYIAYQDVYEPMHQHNLLIPSSNAEGIKWVNLLDDFFYVMSDKMPISNRLRTWLSPLHGKKVYAIFSLSDPLPFIVHIMIYLAKVAMSFIKQNLINLIKYFSLGNYNEKR